MNVGELFVSLGVKGSDKTIGAIAGTRGALKETASVGLETKAAIVGVMYALQQLFSASGKAGTGMQNFTALVGMNARTLQQYQYAARQVGLSNEEMEGTFKALQNAMTNTLMGKGAPEGLGRLAAITGNIDLKEIDEWAKNPEKLLQRLQDYAQKEQNIGLRNSTLKSFGVSEGMSAGLVRNAFTPNVLARAPTYSDNELRSLDKANIAWSNLGTKIEMAIGRFNAKHGGFIVDNISKTVDEVLKLAEAFIKLAEKAELFEKLNTVFQGWKMIFDQIHKVLQDIEKLQTPQQAIEYALGPVEARAVGDNKGPRNTEEAMVNIFMQTLMFADRLKKMNGYDAAKAVGDPLANFGTGAIAKRLYDLAFPQQKALPPGKTGPAEVNVNQTLNFQHPGTDPQKNAESHKESVNRAYRQMGAQAQGS